MFSRCFLGLGILFESTSKQYQVLSAVYFEMHQKHGIDVWIGGRMGGWKLYYKAGQVIVNGRMQVVGILSLKFFLLCYMFEIFIVRCQETIKLKKKKKLLTSLPPQTNKKQAVFVERNFLKFTSQFSLNKANTDTNIQII